MSTGPNLSCSCCVGATEGDLDDLCADCFQAIVKGTRDSHPHVLSAAQQQLRDESVHSGGLGWGREGGG